MICLCGLVVRVPGYRSRSPRFDSRRYRIFWEVVGLERGPLSLLSTTVELLGRNSSGFGLENGEYGRGDSLHWPSGTFYLKKLAPTSPKSGGRSVSIVRFRLRPWSLFFSPHRKMYIRLLVQCHLHPIWPPVLTLNLTYTLRFLLLLPWANLPYTYL
jgi:hypothetical protein